MEKMEETKNWILRAEKGHRIGIRLLYFVGFVLYFYFMNMDRWFHDSWQPFIIGTMAYLLMVPLAILPMHGYLRYRTWKLGRTLGLEGDGFSYGNKLALTKDNQLQVFIPESKWKVKGTGGEFGRGRVQLIPAPKEAVAIHKERQEHLAWSRVVLTETRKLDSWFILGDLLLLCLPQVHGFLLEETGANIIELFLVSIVWLLFLRFVREMFMFVLFKRMKDYVLTNKLATEEQPEYALINTLKTNSVILQHSVSHNCEVKMQTVTLNGALLYGVYRNERLVEHLIIL